MNKKSKCSTCGFEWKTGFDGSHSCSDVLVKNNAEFRKYLKDMEEWYIKQHKVLEIIDDESSDKRLALFCRHLIQKMDEFEI